MSKALARRRSGYEHEIEMRQHRLIVDEPQEEGGTDAGPKPTELLAAALASCTAITLEMYADRKEWELGRVEVEVEHRYESDHRTPRFEVDIRIPERLDEQQRDRIEIIAAKCPVHRALISDGIQVVDRLTAG